MFPNINLQLISDWVLILVGKFHWECESGSFICISIRKFLSFENYFSLGGVMWKFYSKNNIIALALSNYICVGKSNYTNWSAMSHQLPLILIPPLSISLLLSILVWSAISDKNNGRYFRIYFNNISGFISECWNIYIFQDLFSSDS